MIAADSSSLIAFFRGDSGNDVEVIDETLRYQQLVLPPVVLSELLSDPILAVPVGTLLQAIPLLELIDGYWRRAGLLRKRVLVERRRARLADTLIAQACIDHDVALVTRDGDFKNFVHRGGLKLW